MNFILVTDAITDSAMTIRSDLIFKIEETTSSSGKSCRQISFIGDDRVEYVSESMYKLLRLIADSSD